MTDDRGWGAKPGRCPAIDAAGQPCALVDGHEGVHLTRANASRPAISYVVQAVAIWILAGIAAALLPIGGIGGIERFLIALAVVGAILVLVGRRR